MNEYKPALQTTDNTQNQLVTPEQLALSFMEAIRPKSSSWIALYFNLSQLKSYNQTAVMLENAGLFLKRGLSGNESKVFLLSNNDLVAFVQNVGLIKLENYVSEMRKFFSDDPLSHPSTGKENFYKALHLGTEFSNLWQELSAIQPEIKTGVNLDEDITLEPAPSLPFDLLVKLQNTLRNADVTNFVRKQYFYHITSNRKPEKIGCEYYLSLKGIEDVINANAHIVTDFALFKYLSILFDKKMLSHLADVITHVDRTLDIHINMNLRTVVSSEFYDFHQKISPRHITIEIDRTDVIWDLEGFNFACDFLKGYKHKVCLDLMRGTNLRFFANSELLCDTFKIIAEEDIFDYYGKNIKEFVETIGPERIIFARCDSKRSLDEGLRLGVTQFQGYLIDELMKK